MVHYVFSVCERPVIVCSFYNYLNLGIWKYTKWKIRKEKMVIRDYYPSYAIEFHHHFRSAKTAVAFNVLPSARRLTHSRHSDSLEINDPPFELWNDSRTLQRDMLILRRLFAKESTFVSCVCTPLRYSFVLKVFIHVRSRSASGHHPGTRGPRPPLIDQTARLRDQLAFIFYDSENAIITLS